MAALLRSERASAADAPPIHWTVEILGGDALNAHSTLSIRQRGRPELDIHAHWETRAFTNPVYAGVRIGRSGPRGGWDLELLHHKIYLANPTAEVPRFEISHGFNMLTLQRTWIRAGWTLRAGAGPVVSHTENQVRGENSPEGGLPGGYELSGVALQIGGGRRFPLSRRFFTNLEAKATWGTARVSIAHGKASTDDAALHAVVSLGWNFR